MTSPFRLRDSDPMDEINPQAVDRQYSRFLQDRMNYCRKLLLHVGEKIHNSNLAWTLSCSMDIFEMSYEKLMIDLYTRKNEVKEYVQDQGNNFLRSMNTNLQGNLTTVNDIRDWTNLTLRVNNFYNALHLVLDQHRYVRLTQQFSNAPIEIDGVLVKDPSLFLDPSLDQLDESNDFPEFCTLEEECLHYKLPLELVDGTYSDGEILAFMDSNSDHTIMEEEYEEIEEELEEVQLLEQQQQQQIINHVNYEEDIFPMTNPLNNERVSEVSTTARQRIGYHNNLYDNIESSYLMEISTADTLISDLVQDGIHENEEEEYEGEEDEPFEEEEYERVNEEIEEEENTEDIVLSRVPEYDIGIMLIVNNKLLDDGGIIMYKCQLHHHMTLKYLQSLFFRLRIKKYLKILYKKLDKRIILSEYSSGLHYYGRIIQQTLPNMSLSTCKRIFKKCKDLFKDKRNPFIHECREKYLKEIEAPNDYKRHMLSKTMRHQLKIQLKTLLNLLEDANRRSIFVSGEQYVKENVDTSTVIYFEDDHPFISLCFDIISTFNILVEYIECNYRYIKYFDYHLDTILTMYGSKLTMCMNEFYRYTKNIKEIGEGTTCLTNHLNLNLVKLFPANKCGNMLYFERIDNELVHKTLVTHKEMLRKDRITPLNGDRNFPYLRMEENYKETALVSVEEAIKNLKGLRFYEMNDSNEDIVNNLDLYLQEEYTKLRNSGLSVRPFYERPSVNFETSCFANEDIISNVTDIFEYDQFDAKDTQELKRLNSLGFQYIKERYLEHIENKEVHSELDENEIEFYDNEIEESDGSYCDSDEDAEERLMNEYHRGIFLKPTEQLKNRELRNFKFILNNHIIVKHELTESCRIHIRRIIFRLIKHINNKTVLSEEYSKIYYHSRTIQSLFPAFNFPACKFIFATFEKTFKSINPLIEDVREDYFKEVELLSEADKNKFADIVRQRILLRALALFDALRQSFLGFAPPEAREYYTLRVLNDDEPYFDEDHPVIKNTSIIIDRFNWLVQVIVNCYRFIFFFDYKLDRFFRIYANELTECMERIVLTWRYLKRKGENVEIFGDILHPYLNAYFPKIETIDYNENACIGANVIQKTLYKYIDTLKKGPIRISLEAIENVEYVNFYRDLLLMKVRKIYAMNEMHKMLLQSKQIVSKKIHSGKSTGHVGNNAIQKEPQEKENDGSCKRIKIDHDTKDEKKSNDVIEKRSFEDLLFEESYDKTENFSKIKRET